MNQDFDFEAIRKDIYDYFREDILNTPPASLEYFISTIEEHLDEDVFYRSIFDYNKWQHEMRDITDGLKQQIEDLQRFIDEYSQ